MWQSNGFGNFPPFIGDFNTDDYSPSFHSGSSGTPSAGLYPFQQHNLNQDFSGGGYVNNGYHEFGVHNEEAYLHSQAMNAGAVFPTSNSPKPVAASQPRVATQINARAAELKAQLLKGKERRAVSTPPVSTPGNSTGAEAHGLRGQVSTNTSSRNDQELNINELISQYSESKQATDTITNLSDIQKGLKAPTISKGTTEGSGLQSRHPPSLRNSTPTSKGTSNGTGSSRIPNSKKIVERPSSSYSESDGEIIESPPETTSPPTGLKNIPASNKLSDPNEQSTYRAQSSQPVRPSNFRGHKDSPPPRHTASNPRVPASTGHDERRIESLPSKEILSRPEPINGKRSTNERQMALAAHGDTRRHVEAHNTTEHKNGETSQKAPTLDQAILTDLLTRDENLRNWLEITRYHDAPYRDKILNRRRAIAALDAQRERLLAEIEAEERAGPSPAMPSLAPLPAMLRPPVSAKVPSRAESTFKQAPISKPAPIPKSANVSTVPQGDRVVSNKRPYSDIQEKRDENQPKVARMEDRISIPRVKHEDPEPPRRPLSCEVDTSRRSSFDRYDEREPPRPRHEDIRSRRQGHSRERSLSPAPRIYDDRGRGYGSPSPDYFARGERSPRGTSRPFVVRGNYRGRSYDPSYRGRGRGRGAVPGDYQNHGKGGEGR